MRFTCKKGIKGIVFVIGMILSTILLQTTTYATENGETPSTDATSATGFNYQVILPENQIDSNLGYFDLMMSPGQQQVISLTLNNPSDETITVGLSLNGAKTNNNGVIEYNRPDIANDASLQFDFIDLVTAPETVELAGGETKQVDISLQMPETSFEGVIAGGITMQRLEEATTEPSEEDGSFVNNKYAYAVSILLRESEGEIAPELQFNRAFAAQQNYRNTVFVSFSNVAATYVNNLTVDAQITESGSETVLWESRRTAMRMAPNSFMEYPISMGGEQMVPGSYTAHVTAYVGDLKWEWKEEFEISEKEANQYNERDAGLIQDTGLDWKIIAAIVAGFVIIAGITFLVLKKVKKNKRKSPIRKNKNTKKR